MATLLTTNRLNAHHTAYEIEAPELVAAAVPGQHVLARFSGQAHPSPAAIADVDPDKGTLTIVARAVDEAIPEAIDGLDGPFGGPAHSREEGRVLCVAEGLGVAALFPRVRDLKAKGCYTIAVIGYTTKDSVYWQDRFGDYCDELYVITDDGSFGIKGPIQHTVKAVCESGAAIDEAVVIGSLKVMRRVAMTTAKYNIPTAVSLAAVADDDEAVTQLATMGDARYLRYNWANVADLDGHQADYDDLSDKLGLPAR